MKNDEKYQGSLDSGDSSIFVDEKLFALSIETTRVSSPFDDDLFVTVINLEFKFKGFVKQSDLTFFRN